MLTGHQLKKEIISQVSTIKSRDLSVKYDGSYNVSVKKLVPLSPIENIAKKQESYQRDHLTGEILSGGNTFVFVEYMTWDTNKNQPFEIEVPENLLEEAESLLESFQDPSWQYGDWTSRCHHLANKAAELSFFKGWDISDVRHAFNFITRKSEAIQYWINNGPKNNN